MHPEWRQDVGRELDGGGWETFLDVHFSPGVGDGQGGLACCDSLGREESDTTATELNR